MHQACEMCRGACCEGMVIRPQDYGYRGDNLDWWRYHGTATGDGIYFNCRCRHLADGKCAIYGTRPQCCRDFFPGTAACVAAIHRVRPQQARAILAMLPDTGGGH